MMKLKELSKLLSERGLTPEQIVKILDRYEQLKEKSKKYQKERYLKVSVSVKKSDVKKIQRLTDLDAHTIKKYLAAIKLLNSIPEEAKKKIKNAMNLNRDVF
jgi:Fic family protein